MTRRLLHHQNNLLPTPNKPRAHLPAGASLTASACWITLACRTQRWWSFPKRRTFRTSSRRSALKAESLAPASSSSWAGMLITALDLLQERMRHPPGIQLVGRWKRWAGCQISLLPRSKHVGADLSEAFSSIDSTDSLFSLVNRDLECQPLDDSLASIQSLTELGASAAQPQPAQQTPDADHENSQVGLSFQSPQCGSKYWWV